MDVNEKKAVKRSKKKSAFLIDIVFATIFGLVFELILFVLFGINFASVGGFIIDLAWVYIYFKGIPKYLGNTPGRLLFGIKDRYYLFWSPWKKKSTDEFPQKELSVAKELKVIVHDGKWTCPSCNEPNLEFHDSCDNCGQEMEKVYE